jgi:hypothetical protein
LTIARIKTVAGAAAGLFGVLTLWEAKDTVSGLVGLHVIGAAEHGVVTVVALAATGLSYTGYKQAKRRLPGARQRALRR